MCKTEQLQTGGGVIQELKGGGGVAQGVGGGGSASQVTIVSKALQPLVGTAPGEPTPLPEGRSRAGGGPSRLHW